MLNSKEQAILQSEGTLISERSFGDGSVRYPWGRYPSTVDSSIPPENFGTNPSSKAPSVPAESSAGEMTPSEIKNRSVWGDDEYKMGAANESLAGESPFADESFAGGSPFAENDLLLESVRLGDGTTIGNVKPFVTAGELESLPEIPALDDRFFSSMTQRELSTTSRVFSENAMGTAANGNGIFNWSNIKSQLIGLLPGIALQPILNWIASLGPEGQQVYNWWASGWLF